jgi:hypothetical protein
MRILLGCPVPVDTVAGPATVAREFIASFRGKGDNVRVATFTSFERTLPLPLRHVVFFVRISGQVARYSSAHERACASVFCTYSHSGVRPFPSQGGFLKIVPRWVLRCLGMVPSGRSATYPSQTGHLTVNRSFTVAP